MSSVTPGYYPGRTALVALVLAIVGAGLGFAGFVTGVDAALGGQLLTLNIILFFVGVGLLLIALVLSILGLLRTSAKVLSTVALLVAILPITGLIVAALATRH